MLLRPSGAVSTMVPAVVSPVSAALVRPCSSTVASAPTTPRLSNGAMSGAPSVWPSMVMVSVAVAVSPSPSVKV